jgi:DNA-directed RNA polymerase specialized sigma subunit
MTLREAGARMGVSEARACQLHGRAIFNLRRTLSVTMPRVRATTATAA